MIVTRFRSRNEKVAVSRQSTTRLFWTNIVSFSHSRTVLTHHLLVHHSIMYTIRVHHECVDPPYYTNVVRTKITIDENMFIPFIREINITISTSDNDNKSNFFCPSEIPIDNEECAPKTRAKRIWGPSSLVVI